MHGYLAGEKFFGRAMGLKESSMEDLGLGMRMSLNGESVLQYQMVGGVPEAGKVIRISHLP